MPEKNYCTCKLNQCHFFVIFVCLGGVEGGGLRKKGSLLQQTLQNSSSSRPVPASGYQSLFFKIREMGFYENVG